MQALSAELSLGDIFSVAVGDQSQGSAREAGGRGLTVDTLVWVLGGFKEPSFSCS